MTVVNIIGVIIAFLSLGLCIWLESRAIAKHKAQEAKEREAFLEALWCISNGLLGLRFAVEAIHPNDVPSDQGDAS